jgi:hypothetical protein
MDWISIKRRWPHTHPTLRSRAERGVSKGKQQQEWFLPFETHRCAMLLAPAGTPLADCGREGRFLDVVAVDGQLAAKQ